MPTTLVVRGWTEATWRFRLQIDSLQVAVKGQIEIETRLLTVGQHIQAGRMLIMDSSDNGVTLCFSDIGSTELIQMIAGKTEPTRKRITANHSCSQRNRLHVNCQLSQKEC